MLNLFLLLPMLSNFLSSISYVLPAFSGYDVVISFGFFDLFLVLLLQYKVFQYLTPAGRGYASTQMFVDASRLLVTHKHLKDRYSDDPNIIRLSEMTKNIQIPVWLQNIINCVPVLPLNPLETFELYSKEVTMDRNNTSSTQITTMYTQAMFINLNNFLILVNNKDLYKGDLTKCDFSTRTFEIFQISVSSALSAPSTTLLFNNKFLTVLANPTGSSRPFTNVAIANSEDTRTFTLTSASDFVITPQVLFTVLLLQPTFTGFNLTTVLTDMLKPYQTATVTVASADWQLLVNRTLIFFPNPEEVSANQIPSESGISNQGQSPPGSKIQGYSGLPSISLTKVRKAKEAKVSFVRVGLKLEGLAKKISSEEQKSFKTVVGTSLANLEKAANILQVDSTQLLKLLSKEWPDAKESIDPKFGDQSQNRPKYSNK